MKNKVAKLGVFLALALILSYVESLIPFYFGVPGMKLGLTNIVVVLLMYLSGPLDAFVVSMLRILLAGFMFGNGFSILYSLAGGILSFLVMMILKKCSRLHIVTISMFGGITHNLGQILFAVFLVDNYNVMFYFPVLFVAGTITGLLIGILAKEVYQRIKIMW